MQISCILSDYDGTLSPATNNKTASLTNSKIELDRVLWEVSRKRLIAIISTKDFNFLHDRTKFANIVSCMMSIETMILKHVGSAGCYSKSCVKKSMLNIDFKILSRNYQKLESIIDRISLKFKNVSIYRKLTFEGNLLGGVTIDWRHLEDWNSIKGKIEEDVLRITNQINDSSEYPLFVQTYSTHPFIDIYLTFCSKAIAYDNIRNLIHDSNSDKFKNKNILYLGDSENDNPAFRKADVSIGVKSDIQLNPKLDCQYLINFTELRKFLMKLLKNNFNFSDKLL
jgi:hypothetical protein